MSGLSFKVRKGREPVRLGPSAVAEAGRGAGDEAEVTVIDGHFDAVAAKPAKNQLVIPLITKNRWRVDAVREADPLAAEMAAEEESELEKTAKAALLAEAAALAGKEEGGEGEASTSTAIPLLYANQVPGGFETDEKLDVRLRADEPEEADYDSVPIGDYGLAMLRGMGWKEGEGIGRTHKAAVVTRVPELRPKGLGLGADKALVQALKSTKTAAKALLKENASADDKTLRPGVLVKVTSRGPHKGAYGKVSSMDADNNRVLVRLALGGATASVPLLGVAVVDKTEYEREAKCINKDHYDRYKAKQAAPDHRVAEEPLVVEEGDLRGPQRKERKDKKRRRSVSPALAPPPVKRAPWLRPDLRVRLVDDTHAAHLQKIRVVDVAAEGVCSCLTEDGRLLDALKESQLETVIPRGEGPLLVMLVAGKHRGEVGELVSKDKRRCEGTIQLTRRKDKLIQAHFDDICEFVGDLSAYETY